MFPFMFSVIPPIAQGDQCSRPIYGGGNSFIKMSVVHVRFTVSKVMEQAQGSAKTSSLGMERAAQGGWPFLSEDQCIHPSCQELRGLLLMATVGHDAENVAALLLFCSCEESYE